MKFSKQTPCAVGILSSCETRVHSLTKSDAFFTDSEKFIELTESEATMDENRSPVPGLLSPQISPFSRWQTVSLS